MFRASRASGGTGVLGSRPPRSISRPDVCCLGIGRFGRCLLGIGRIGRCLLGIGLFGRSSAFGYRRCSSQALGSWCQLVSPQQTASVWVRELLGSWPSFGGARSEHALVRPTPTSSTTSPTSRPTRRGVLLLPPTLQHLLLGLVLGVIIQQGGGCGIRRMTTLGVIPALSCGPLY